MSVVVMLRCVPDCLPGLLDGPDSRGLRQVHDAWGSVDTFPLLGVVCGVLGVLVLVVVVMTVTGWWIRRRGPEVMTAVVMVPVLVLAGVSVATLVVESFWAGAAGLLLAAFNAVVLVSLDEHVWSGSRRG